MRHPLTQAMGLSVYKNPNGSDWVSADELERVLGQAPVVQSNSSTPDSDWSGWSAGRKITHTARLLCIQPIKAPDTAESLLRELDKRKLHTFARWMGGPRAPPFGEQVTFVMYHPEQDDQAAHDLCRVLA